MKQNNVPESVQEMLWVAAESSDAATVAEFERRYPQYAAELARVRAMVEAMRRARPAARPAAQFYRPAARPASAPARLALVAGVVVGLALVGYGAYRITGFVTHRDGAGWNGTGTSGDQTPTDVTSGPGTSTTPPPTSSEPDPRGIAERPVPQAPRDPVITLRGDSTLFQAISAFRSAGMTMHVDPAVEDAALGLAPENPDAILTLPPEEAVLVLERLAPVRVQEIGTKEYLVVPLEKVNNVEGPQTRPAEPSLNQGAPG